MIKRFKKQGTLRNKPFEVRIKVLGDLTAAEAQLVAIKALKDTKSFPAWLSHIPNSRLAAENWDTPQSEAGKVKNLPQPYRTYKFYTKKGERLAIFALPNKTQLEAIYVLRCSSKDQFSKQVAKEAFSKYLQNNKQNTKDYHFHKVELHNIEPTYANFLNVCKQYFHVKSTRPIVSEVPVFVKEFRQTPVSSSKELLTNF